MPVDQDEIHRLSLSENLEDRLEAVKLLKKIFKSLHEKSDAFYDLHRLTDDADPSVRNGAANAIGSVFKSLSEYDKSDALQQLHRLTDDADPSVRNGAANALNLIFSSIPEENKYSILYDLHKSTDDADLSSSINELNFSSHENESEISNLNFDASIHKANITDQPSTKDFLGFEPYVQAIYEFLKNPATKPPLTLSIEGPWGIGKSSFMSQLKNKFDDDKALTVEFNPWRHDKEDALWAFFAIEFINQLRGKLGKWENITGYVKLFKLRINWGFGTFKSILIYFIIPTLISLYLYFGIEQTVLPKIVPIVPFSVPLFGILKQVQDNINPLASDFKKYYSAPNYKQHVAFIEHFHKDFQNIVDAYTANRDKDEKIYVFIDDLDRCEIPKAAELLQALNLMIASDHRIIFIIGLDRMKVAAGLAVKYEPILPYLNPQPCITQKGNDFPKRSIKGLEFGYEFIEKFIQVPFSVPQPDNINIKKLIKEMSPKEATEPHNVSSSAPSNKEYQADAQKFSTQTPTIDEIKNEVPEIELEVEKKRAENKSNVTQDSEKIREIALMVSTALDNNPRRMKQFINLFRLRVFIATETGLLDKEKDLTLEQLGKFVAIALKWPLLIANLDKNPKLLNELHKIAIGTESGDSEDAEHWKSESKLMDLLKFRCDTESSEKYSLENLVVKDLLKV